MWFRRAIKTLVVLFLLAPVPALVAPYVTDEPVKWAYSVYHPGFYRYPVRTGAQLSEAKIGMMDQPRWAQSIAILGLMIEHW